MRSQRLPRRSRRPNRAFSRDATGLDQALALAIAGDRGNQLSVWLAAGTFGRTQGRRGSEQLIACWACEVAARSLHQASNHLRALANSPQSPGPRASGLSNLELRLRGRPLCGVSVIPNT